MNKQHFILAIAWILFCIIHSVTAAEKFKLLVHRFPAIKAHFRIFYSAAAIVTLALVLSYQFNMHSSFLFRLPGTVMPVPFITGIFGACVMALSMYNYFATGVALKGNHLVVRGLNRFVRHP